MGMRVKNYNDLIRSYFKSIQSTFKPRGTSTRRVEAESWAPGSWRLPRCKHRAEKQRRGSVFLANLFDGMAVGYCPVVQCRCSLPPRPFSTLKKKLSRSSWATCPTRGPDGSSGLFCVSGSFYCWRKLPQGAATAYSHRIPCLFLFFPFFVF